jgi:ABC-type transport system involved in multi-copper enzyme maturation permease subunit
MTRIVRAELLRLLRRRTLVITTAVALVFGAVATLLIYSGAQETGPASRRSGATIASLAGHGGGTEAFAVAASFVGFFVFVTFIALLATEFSGGTFRALLLRDPHRGRLIVGKLVGILVVCAGVVALTEVVSFVVSLAVAPSKGIALGPWFSVQGVGAALSDFGTVFAGVAGWAMFGTTLAVIFRSAPLALGVGFAWAGPFENIVSRSWETGYRIFPGQVLDSLIRGGTTELGFSRAVLTAAAYVAIAAAAALTLVVRRDVTA